ncbi:MAG: Glycosyl transferase family 2 [Microgenomates group bacterium GW2011_GWC1_43_11]|uniref:Glycosyl transferase family 2 n=2 Tax=Candidatus Gottesmaniibacteriota TaxID=1752720 RepID=A0A0G1IPC1_9BACT|nr:MAG: Glycosyl transferase family 2 [Microgenomates group bacterium GW2011_GWC1_43_11]KKT37602.1 MAG: Glycosyl transferase family 2 [Candidatus Gottesmanbacteria bacterium GW2011_GWB1_44_11c]KKT61015.1 MAG: Glycosyl transferase family 2 [Candidatus Gottesmanbacteria bacterium GW2011_GWA1_44_24b]
MEKKISIIIPTYKRGHIVKTVIDSILCSTYQNFEILVIEQRGNDTLQKFIDTYHKPDVIFFYNVSFIGASRAKNFGIKKANGKIIAFTDDDCVVDKNWLFIISQLFETQKDIVGCNGEVFPFMSTLHDNEFCPSTFTSNSPCIIKNPCLHSKYIGFGNNMALKRNVLLENKGYKTWLGPGSLGQAAEDAELSLRLIIKGYKLIYNPKSIVYHNKWLTEQEMKNLELSYLCGELACYGYYFLSGYSFAQKVIKDNVVDSFYDMKRIFGDIFKRKTIRTNDWKYSVMKLITRMKGFFIGLFYYLKEVVFRIKDESILINKL